MTKTDKYSGGVKEITSLARSINSQIGSYQEHFVDDRMEFSVRLNNGTIEMSRLIAEDYEALPNSITSEQIARVASTFRRI